MSNDKSAQDIMEKLRRGGNFIGDKANDIGGSISDWYNDINPEARKALMRGLIGAGVGGALSGGVAAMGPRDRESKSPVLGPALLGALMGGGAAAGIPAGLKMLSGGIKLPGEKGRPAGAKAVETLAGPAARNPATTIGGIWGARKLYKGQGPVRKAWEAAAPAAGKLNASKLHNILQRARGTWKGTTFKPGGGRAAMLAPVAGMALGGVVDKYIKGDY